MLKNIL